jgi:hypothetical protein
MAVFPLSMAESSIIDWRLNLPVLIGATACRRQSLALGRDNRGKIGRIDR